MGRFPNAADSNHRDRLGGTVADMQPDQQALIGATHLEAAVLDAIDSETLTRHQIRQRVFPGNSERSSAIVGGVLWRLVCSDRIDVDQSGQRQHYRYSRRCE